MLDTTRTLLCRVAYVLQLAKMASSRALLALPGKIVSAAPVLLWQCREGLAYLVTAQARAHLSAATLDSSRMEQHAKSVTSCACLAALATIAQLTANALHFPVCQGTTKGARQQFALNAALHAKKVQKPLHAQKIQTAFALAAMSQCLEANV